MPPLEIGLYDEGLFEKCIVEIPYVTFRLVAARIWCGITGYRVGAPFKWDVFTTAGVSTGIVLFYLR